MNYNDTDDDGDDIPTSVENDKDGDGEPDYPLPDQDQDGVPDYLESSTKDTDGDGIFDHLRDEECDIVLYGGDLPDSELRKVGGIKDKNPKEREAHDREAARCAQAADHAHSGRLHTKSKTVKVTA